jgi:hypothetical protein
VPACVMHAIFPPTHRALRRDVVLVICCVAVLLTASVQAANGWIEISSSMLQGLTNSGAKPLWP